MSSANTEQTRTGDQQRHKILDAIVDRAVPVGSVNPHPRNYNSGAIGKIAASLQANGQYRTIVVQQSTGFICAGNSTWKAAQSAGWSHIAADLVDIDDATALRILAVDNKLARDSEWDDRALAELLGEVAEELGTLDGTGFDEDELAKLLDGLDGGLGEGDADIDDGPEQVWGVIITCGSEDEQVDLLDRLDAEGLKVRAMVA